MTAASDTTPQVATELHLALARRALKAAELALAANQSTETRVVFWCVFDVYEAALAQWAQEHGHIVEWRRDPAAPKFLQHNVPAGGDGGGSGD